MITDYKVVEASSAAEMLTLAAAAIAAGFQPFGTPFERTSPNYPANAMLCQAFVKGLLSGSALGWVDVTATAALLDGAGTVPVIVGGTGDQYKVRDIRLVGGGTNFGAGGNRLLDLTDGTTVWTEIANADIETAPTVTLDWGDAKVPFLTGTSEVASAAGSTIGFKYNGGTTDHVTGSIKFSVLLEKVA